MQGKWGVAFKMLFALVTTNCGDLQGILCLSFVNEKSFMESQNKCKVWAEAFKMLFALVTTNCGDQTAARAILDPSRRQREWRIQVADIVSDGSRLHNTQTSHVRASCWSTQSSSFWGAAIIRLVKDQVSSKPAEAETAITEASPVSYYPMDKTSQRTAIPGLSKDAAAAVTGNVGSAHCLRMLLLLLSTYVVCYCWA